MKDMALTVKYHVVYEDPDEFLMIEVQVSQLQDLRQYKYSRGPTRMEFQQIRGNSWVIYSVGVRKCPHVKLCSVRCRG